MTNFFSYKLLISYIGTDYSGWQRQSPEYNTVQGEIESTIQKILKHRDFSFYGSSRTDTGVHAMGQVALLKSKDALDVETFLWQLNQHLPNAIRILSLDATDSDFNPQINLQSKEYHYYFSSKTIAAHSGAFVFEVNSELDIEKMQKASHLLLGLHDFSKFTTDKIAHGNTKREIFHCEIKEEKISFQSDSVLVFKIEGSGFLKYMVRNLFGHILKIGLGELELPEFEGIINGVKDTRVKKAPAKGLHLVRINYSGK